MNLKHLNDKELLSQTQRIVRNERQLLTQILHHLQEVERRKLFSDLGYQSLFEYAVKELKYSEGQAGRRIQAMRLIKELPCVETKIESGSLSLSNVSQAQSYFREARKLDPKKTLETKIKLEILESLEHKSAREGQKILIQREPQMVGLKGSRHTIQQEREITLTELHTEVRFVMTQDLKSKLNELRSLLGLKGINMGLAELIDYMAGVSLEDVKIKKFGKKRLLAKTKLDFSSTKTSNPEKPSRKSARGAEPLSKATNTSMMFDKNTAFQHIGFSSVESSNLESANDESNRTPTSEFSSVSEFDSEPELGSKSELGSESEFGSESEPEQEVGSESERRPRQLRVSRYISKKTQHQVWMRDGGKCRKCRTQRHLNIDHVRPVALGGCADIENLRLLCFNCNQRQAIKTFGHVV